MEEQWEKDKEQIMALAKQAQDSASHLATRSLWSSHLLPVQMADLSESTLDSVLSTIESLKAVSA